MATIKVNFYKGSELTSEQVMYINLKETVKDVLERAKTLADKNSDRLRVEYKNTLSGFVSLN